MPILLGTLEVLRTFLCFLSSWIFLLTGSHNYRKDALRSLIISQQMLGTREIALFHHTGCGMASCTSHGVRQRVRENLPADRKEVAQVDGIDFLEFSNLEGSVKEDVEWLKAHPLILPGTVVTGWVYEVESGAVSIISS
jgi:carbonic anhydrase